MTAYATKRDVYALGLPRGSLGNPGRLVASSLAVNSTVELSEHGFVQDDKVTVRATEGGNVSAPLVTGTVYYVIPLTDSTFQLASTQGGPAITFTSDANSMVVTADLPWDELLEYFSRFVDGFLPADAVPLKAPYPITVIGTVAELVGRKIQILSGTTSESMREMELAAKSKLERWVAGLPVRDAQKTNARTNLAVVKSSDNGVLGYPLFGGSGYPRDNGGFF